MRLASVALFLVASIHAQGGPAPNGDSWVLFHGLRDSTRIDLTVPPGACEKAALLLARNLAVWGGARLFLGPEERDPKAVRMQVGTFLEPELADLALYLGAEPIEGGFRILGRDYVEAGDALVAVFEDPRRQGRPLCLVVGNDSERLDVYLDSIPRLSRPYLWVHGDGEPSIECSLALDGTPRLEGLRDYAARREAYFTDGKKREFDGLVVHVAGALDMEKWRSYGLALAGARERVIAWLGAEEPPTVDLFLYEDLQDFEACTGGDALYLVNRSRPRVHVLLARGMPDDGGAGLARALVRAIAGLPANAWFEEGLAIAAANSWWGRPLDDWLLQLVSGSLLPSPAELRGARGPLSEHLLGPGRAFLVQQMLTFVREDPGRVRSLWKGAEAKSGEVDRLYRRSAQLMRHKKGGKPKRKWAQKPPPTPVPPYRRGLALVASEAAGYSSSFLEEALAEAAALGPDALSLTVFASAEDPLPPVLAPARRTAYGSASDLSLARCVGAAHARKLDVLLSLEVLARPHGAWADVISWTNPDDPDTYFERYTSVALHYALLAELIGVEVFSFGSNLRESMRTEDQDEGRDPDRILRRQRGWKRLIAVLRGAYQGGLTVAARYPGEAQFVGMFEDLDYLSLLFYPSLTRGGKGPEDGSLRRILRFEVQQAIDLAVRWNKPLLLLQVGHPSRSDSWARPLVPRGEVDPQAQVRFFEAFADALGEELENGAALRGFFLWNWPLDPGLVGSAEPGFSLRGKPVEAVLQRLFTR